MSITQRKQIGADSSKKNELDLGWSYVRRQRSFQDINLIAFNVLHILRELVWQRIRVIEKSQVIVTKQDPPPPFLKKKLFGIRILEWRQWMKSSCTLIQMKRHKRFHVGPKQGKSVFTKEMPHQSDEGVNSPLTENLKYVH